MSNKSGRSKGSKGRPAKRQAVAAMTGRSMADISMLERQRKNEMTALTKKLFDALEYEPIEKVGEAIGQLLKGGHKADGVVTLKMKNGETKMMCPIIKWAHDRYDTDEEFYTNLPDEKPFLFDLLSEKNEKEDASETLRMLLEAGANPRSKLEPSNQTLLHLCMIQGDVPHKQLFARARISALLEQVTFSFDHLAIKDSSGESALHCALSHSNFDCAELVLFSGKVDVIEVLNNLTDDRGDNILASLVRYTDLPYDAPKIIFDTHVSSPSFQLFEKLVSKLEEAGDYRPFLRKNNAGENVFALAAKCGCHRELKLLTSIKYETFWTVANVCTHADEVGAGSVYSPLELATKTLEMLKAGCSEKEFEDAGICGTGAYLGVQKKKETWSKVLGLCIKELENIGKPRFCTMEDVRQLRGGSNREAILLNGQTLSSKSRELQRKMQPSRISGALTLQFEQKEYWENVLSRSEQSAVFHEVRKRLQHPAYPYHDDAQAITSVSPMMIRDPKDPCHRASIFPTVHFGLFATRKIPRHTIICEYAGEVRREDEGGYDPIPEYAVKLQRCDDHVGNEKRCSCKAKQCRCTNTTAEQYRNGFILDGEIILNEASIINDSRSSLVGEEDTEHRDNNVEWMEVIANGWPHTFIITTAEINEGEEILIDYGPDYWEKITNKRTQQLRQREKKEREELDRKNDELRKML